MTYFNKKEDVYHIELTPHGRYLLSIGKLNFKSYAFFDDDVLYDVARLGVQEEQNSIKTRIQDNTPHLKQNGNYYSVETNWNTMESEQVYLNEQRKQIKFESFHYLNNSIGSHEYRNEKSTNFKVDFLNNEMLSFSQTVSPSPSLGGQYSYIPQVDFEIEYKTRRGNISDDQSSSPGLDNVNFSTIFGDGSYVDVLEEDVILQIQELNSEYLSENFRLEVYIEESYGESSFLSSYKYYRPLVFKNQVQKIVNGMLLSDEEIQDQEEDIGEQIADNGFVEYYFTLNVDKEIASEEICALVNQIEERNFHISDDFRCEDLAGEQGLDIYSSNIGSGDLEDC
tara:strand:- start:658 stop:1674 length:1017 start_codon:yes stop_codon:yes gene_type:complete